MGRPICAETQGFRSTSGMVKALWDGFNGQPHDMIMRRELPAVMNLLCGVDADLVTRVLH